MEAKGLTAFTPDMDCDQTVMGLSPVTSAVFLIANSFGKRWVSQRYLICLLPLNKFGDDA
jgi:hypothetical protein